METTLYRTMTNLIQSWLAAEAAQGRNKTDATAALNKATGMRYTLHRILEWERGDRELPGKVRRYMIGVVLPDVLAGAGVETLSAAKLRKIAQALS